MSLTSICPKDRIGRYFVNQWLVITPIGATPIAKPNVVTENPS